MEKTSVRLSPEITKKLQDEARKLAEESGETVTISDLIRASICEKFPQVCGRIRREKSTIQTLSDEVAALGERSESLGEEVEKLAKTLSEIVPLLATKGQVQELTEAIASVIKAVREG